MLDRKRFVKRKKDRNRVPYIRNEQCRISRAARHCPIRAALIIQRGRGYNDLRHWPSFDQFSQVFFLKKKKPLQKYYLFSKIKLESHDPHTYTRKSYLKLESFNLFSLCGGIDHDARISSRK